MLIGRDCTVAQFQQDMTFSDDKRQIASRTPFGWVLIGEQIDPSNNKCKKNTSPIYYHKLLNNLLPQITDKTATKYIKEFNITAANDAIELQGLKEEELKGYSQDETAFLRKVANHAYQRKNSTTRALPKGFSGSRQCLKTEKCERKNSNNCPVA